MGTEEAVIVLRHRPVVLPQHFLEIVNSRPNQWSVVGRGSGAPYAVCPSCADRVPLQGLPDHLACTHCHQRFDVEQAAALASSARGPSAVGRITPSD